MKLNRVLVALTCLAVLAFAMPQVIRADRQGITVIATAYTCEAHPRNPMYPCGRPRWGGDPYGPGMACPHSWRDRYMEVPGYGVLRCDDTGGYETWNGYPHIDIRVSTYAEAYDMGFRRMVIYPVDGPAPSSPPARPPAPTAAPAPAEAPVEAPAAAPAEASAPISPESAISLAHSVAPKGDAGTAIARLMPLGRAVGLFPAVAGPIEMGHERAVWLVSLWVPPETIPAGAVAQPDATRAIAARLFIFDALTSKTVADAYISSDQVEVMGWAQSDSVAPGQ